MKQNKLIRKIVLLTSPVVLFFALHSHNYETNYKLIETSEGKTTFSCDDKLIYISSKDFELSIDGIDYICILDDRNNDDPNIKVYNSCFINDKDLQNDILCCLLEYEKMYPTEWDRTIESMRNEWTMHNLCYKLRMVRERTTDLDLNNTDETVYDSPILKKVFRN